MHRPGAPAFTIKADGDTLAVKQVKVFIELDDIGVLEQIERLGGKVYTDFGNCVTASVPVASLRDISELEGIKFIEMGSPVNLLMDKARVATGVDIVHLNSNKDLPNPYTGKGVVIGIIDTGMDTLIFIPLMVRNVGLNGSGIKMVLGVHRQISDMAWNTLRQKRFCRPG